VTEAEWQRWFAEQLRGLRQDLNALRNQVATKEDLRDAVREAINHGNLEHKAFHEKHLRIDHAVVPPPVSPAPPRRTDDPEQLDMRSLRNSELTSRRVWVMWGVGIFMLVIIAEQLARILFSLLESHL
jgi:hypothetical protein